MQNAGIAALGLDWRYLACDVHPDDLATAILGAKSMKFVGLNLTVPHKLLALKLVDELDESARAWGSVNTVRFEACLESGEFRPLGLVPAGEVRAIRSQGFNTDADALSLALHDELGFQPRGRCVLLLGAGGAGRAAALKLASAGVSRLYVQNRTPEKAEAIAADLRSRFPDTEVRTGIPKESVDLLLNATSLGLQPSDPLPLDLAKFPIHQTRAVFDMVYRPAVSPLLRIAAAAGCRTANGLSMLLYQGAKALELWTGQAAPLGPMRQALEKNVYS